MNPRRFVGLALAFIVFAPTTASAYVQTMTCSKSGGPFACAAGEEPRPVRWPKRCIQYYVNEVGSDDIAGAELNVRTLEAIEASFDAWSDVSQADLRLEYAGLTNEDRAEFASDRGDDQNANVVMWRDNEWPYASTTAFAITSVTFDPSSGKIADADIELNGQYHRFTVGDEAVVVDVQNTLTHEVGHFVGLDHTGVGDATMFGSAPEGELQKRSLHSDDIQGLANIYPPTGSDITCESTPDYFEKPTGDGDNPGCCAVVSSDGDRRATLWALLFGLVALAARRRERLGER